MTSWMNAEGFLEKDGTGWAASQFFEGKGVGRFFALCDLELDPIVFRRSYVLVVR